MGIFGKGKDQDRGGEPKLPRKGEGMIAGKKNGPSLAANPNELNALLGRGSEFEGKLSFEGTVRIDGTFRGDIQSGGLLMIGEPAKVEAEITVDAAVIGGEVQGNITARSRIELQPTARVSGTLSTPALVVQQGALFDGHCQMQRRERSARPVTLLTQKPASETQAEPGE
jgi:cytoskeletal protein CcmA (bactofilin family)